MRRNLLIESNLLLISAAQIQNAEQLLTSSVDDYVEFDYGVVTCSDLTTKDMVWNSMKEGEASDIESEDGVL